jgi:predicted branched-subunit amino acid permease
MTRQSLFSPPVRDGLGLGLAVGVSGLAFGAAASTAGLSAAQASALSLLAFTGPSQFALVGVVAAGGGLVAGVAGALLLGVRNTFYGLYLAPVLGWRGARTPLAAQGVIDETTAMVQAQPDRKAARAAFAATFAAIYLTWNATTVIGVLAAERVGDPDAWGLDAVGPAVFLALLWPRLCEGAAARRVAVLGAALALATTPFVPPGVPILLAAAAVLAAGRHRPEYSDTAAATGDTEGVREGER